MRQHQTRLSLPSTGKGFTDITAEIQAAVQTSGITVGMAHLFLRHTSASLIIQENADPAVLRDLAHFLDRLVPESGRYEHDAEGPDDMPAHIRSVLTQTSESIPVASRRLVLGTWQAVYLWEHRHRAHTRELVVHIIGD